MGRILLYYWLEFAPSAHLVIFWESQITKLTTNRASQIITNQINADFITDHHLVYLSSSPAEVSIKNHPYISIINAISAKIPSNQFVVSLITSRSQSFLSPSTHQTLIFLIDFTASVPFLWYQKLKSNAYVVAIFSRTTVVSKKLKRNFFITMKKIEHYNYSERD